MSCSLAIMPSYEVLDIHFPDPREALADGLLAYGGVLTPAVVFKAHSLGIFPWFNAQSEILWWSPDPRAVILTSAIHVSRSLKRHLRRQYDYRLTLDTDFEQVIDYCASTHGETWITPEMRDCYVELHHQGRAHSCELWQANKLIGGLYGVGLHRVFCGESMFSLQPNASKVVLIALANFLANIGITHIDTQFLTPHLISMGAVNITRDDYLALLTHNPDTHQGSWQQTLNPSTWQAL